MIKLIARIALILGLTALCLALISCGEMLNQALAKDRDLGHMVEENVHSDFRLRVNLVSFTNIAPGDYTAVCKDIANADDAGKFGYNLMVILDERNNTVVKTGHPKFTIFGEQDDVPIFEVVYGPGYIAPLVTLKGPYEGVAWSK